MLCVRRRKQADVLLVIVSVSLLVVVGRLVSWRFEEYADDIDVEGAEDDDHDGSKALQFAGQESLLNDANLDEVQRQIRKLLVLPSTVLGLTSVDSGTAGFEGGRRRRGRRGRRRRRRRRRGRRRGGGIGTAAAAGGRHGDFSQHGQSRFVDRKLRGLVGGFFVESGASDGETGSNSLFFEVERNWTGLLIEPNPKSFKAIVAKKRRAYALNACLSPTGTTASVRFKPAGGIGGIVDHMPPGHRQLVDRYGFDDVNATCFSLYDVIRSLPVEVSRINYWSLDVEGAELPILERINWAQLVPIDVISIEFKVKDATGQTDQQATAEKLMALRKLFDQTKLYRELGKLHDVDVIFGRTDTFDSSISPTDQQAAAVAEDGERKDPDTAGDQGYGDEGQEQDQKGVENDDQPEGEDNGENAEADKADDIGDGEGNDQDNKDENNNDEDNKDENKNDGGEEGVVN